MRTFFILLKESTSQFGSDALSPPPALLAARPRLLSSSCFSESYSQRAAVRAALAQDPSWISEYISMALPMLTSQDNEVTYLVPWSHLQKPPKEGGKPRPHSARCASEVTCDLTSGVFQACTNWLPT